MSVFAHRSILQAHRIVPTAYQVFNKYLQIYKSNTQLPLLRIIQ